MADNTIVGLEIGEHCVRAAEIRKAASKSPVLVTHGEVDLPEGAARDSEVFDRDAVALALTQLWEQAKISTRNVVLGIGNRRVLVRDYQAPLLPLEQIKQALPFQVGELLPVPVDQAVLDFYPLREAESESGPVVEGLLIAGVAEMIENLIATLHRAKLKVSGVDLAPFGVARAAANAIDPAQNALVIHAGARISHLVVMTAGVPRLVRIVPGGIPMRPWSGEADPTVGRRRIQARLTALEDLMVRVRDTTDFYATRHPDFPIEAVYLCGEGAAHPDIVRATENTVGRPASLIHLGDVVKVSRKSGEIDDVTDLGMVTQAGLAFGGTK